MDDPGDARGDAAGTRGLPSPAELARAAAGLAEVLVPTPPVPLRGDPRGAGVWLKPEVHQRVGSFKIRGVFHAVRSMDPAERARGLETVSAGNTAQALAWVGRHFGVPARSLMPAGAPRAKVEAVRALGGTPVLVPMDEVFRYLREHLWEDGPYAFVHPWTDRRVWTGHGTLGSELLRELPGLDTVYVPVGGGGLLAGVGGALSGSGVRVVAVEPAGCPSFHAARAAGGPVEVACDTACDGVAVPYVTEELYPILCALADEVRLVPEEDVRAAVRLLALGNGIVAEPSGALALAAALAEPAERRGTCACLVTGSSIDRGKLLAILGEEAPAEGG